MGFQGGEDSLVRMHGSHPGFPVSGVVVVHAGFEKFKQQTQLELL